MSLVRFTNGIGSVTPYAIYSEEFTYEGVTRPALRFRFESGGFSLEELSAMFSSNRCKTLTIVEESDEGCSEYLYENYTVRARLAIDLESVKDAEGNYTSQEFINITMAKRTELELSYERLAEELEITQLAMLEMYEEQEV